MLSDGACRVLLLTWGWQQPCEVSRQSRFDAYQRIPRIDPFLLKYGKEKEKGKPAKKNFK